MRYRDQIIVALEAGPRCARELAEAFGKNLRTTHTAMRRLAENHLIECVTPDEAQARLYGLTSAGRVAYYELTGKEPDRQPTVLDLGLYTYVQAGSCRRLVLALLTEPRTVSQITKLGRQRGAKLYNNHVADALSDLEATGLALRDERRWSLTANGLAIHDHQQRLNQTASDHSLANDGD